MTDCQRKAQLNKIKSYSMQAMEAQKLLEEQKKRVLYFQGLITQLRMAIKEQEESE